MSRASTAACAPAPPGVPPTPSAPSRGRSRRTPAGGPWIYLSHGGTGLRKPCAAATRLPTRTALAKPSRGKHGMQRWCSAVAATGTAADHACTGALLARAAALARGAPLLRQAILLETQLRGTPFACRSPHADRHPLPLHGNRTVGAPGVPTAEVSPTAAASSLVPNTARTSAQCRSISLLCFVF